MSTLPIEDVLPALRHTLTEDRNAVLTAAPGAGKTTRVPLALLDAPWLEGKKLLMLEPRRLATRAAAYRMAGSLGESIGETVGYRMRLDTKVSPKTRIEVVTEGILSRLLQHDPALSGYAIVLFDEFHERSLQADIGLALCLEVQRLFRPDLRLLVMSATLDCDPISKLLGDAPVITCEGRMFPVETRYLEQPLSGRLDRAVIQTITRSLAQDHGSLLVFLPGMAEIRRVERALLDLNLGSHILIAPLHGDLPQEVQDRAIAPTQPGVRKIVLATSIAETSLTIDGVRVVIDAGLLRVPRFDPRSGLTRLETMRVTQDSAEQRCGRAARVEPGVCVRLWTSAEHQSLVPRRAPEILDADLAPLMLELALWGAADPAEFSWLTPPPPGAVAHARDLLINLGALNPEGRITPHGRQMAELPLHPRLAHMLLTAVPLQFGHLACTLAALLSERDILRGAFGQRNADLRIRLDVLREQHDHAADETIDRAACRRITRTADLWQRQFLHTTRSSQQGDLDEVGHLLALAYPDRIAQRQQGHDARYLMANGRGALFANPDPLASEDYLVIADLDGGQQWARIDRAAPVTLRDLETLYAEQIRVIDAVVWDDTTQMVRATRQRRLGQLILSEHGLSKPDPSAIATALLQGIRQAGLDKLAWTPELRQWRARVVFLRRIEGQESRWPDLSDEALLRTLDDWLGPYVSGLTTLDRVTRLDLTQPLHALLSWEQQRQLERWAPTHLTVPSGSNVRVEYEASDLPILAVRLQEMFGCKDTPRLVDGKIPVMLHLLSPAKRPVQVTKDSGQLLGKCLPRSAQRTSRPLSQTSLARRSTHRPPTAKTKRRSRS